MFLLFKNILSKSIIIVNRCNVVETQIEKVRICMQNSSAYSDLISIFKLNLTYPLNCNYISRSMNLSLYTKRGIVCHDLSNRSYHNFCYTGTDKHSFKRACAINFISFHFYCVSFYFKYSKSNVNTAFSFPNSSLLTQVTVLSVRL